MNENTAVELLEKSKSRFIKDEVLDLNGWIRYMEVKMLMATVGGLMAESALKPILSGKPLDANEAAAICGQMHGWIVGLRADARK